MNARNKTTGAAIVGTVETLIGTCKAHLASFDIDGNGELYCSESGDLVLDWDSVDGKEIDGELMFVDANGDHVKQSEIELIDDDAADRMTLHRGMYDHENRGRHMIYAVAADKQSNVSLVETGSDRAADLRRARAAAVEAGIEDQIDWTDVQDDN